MAYRNDIDALAARDAVLAREVAEKQRELADVQRMLEEARAAEAALAREHDVMVGQRRMRRILIGGLVLVAAGVAAVAVVYDRDEVAVECGPPPHPVLRPAELATQQQEVARDEKVAYDLALASKGLEPVTLEPRFVGGPQGFASRAALDAELGEPVEAWQQFLYTRDAQPRPAVASDVVRVSAETTHEFVKDGFGGVWRVRRQVTPTRTHVLSSEGCDASSGLAFRPGEHVTRNVWLLPLGSHFRGDVEVAYAAPQLAVQYADGPCP